MLDEVADISDRSADEAESVSAVIEEQTASMGEISQNMDSVAATADELKTLLSAFTCGTMAIASDPMDRAITDD
jgi:methyl-accepting chemotaxis protein